MDGAIYSEDTPDRIMPDQKNPLDALALAVIGYVD
jgi:hypothetical protein